jgi:hypothetical protein
MVTFGERWVREGFVCVAEVKVAMIQNVASHGLTFDMLKFRESYFQISLVKMTSYNKCGLRICGFQFT